MRRTATPAGLTGPMNVLVGLVGATAGAVAGELIRRRLSGSPYRLGEEVDQATLGPRPWVTAVAAAAAAALSFALAPDRWPLLVVAVPVALGGLWLSAVDFDVNRLPDRVMLPLLAWVMASVVGLGLLTPYVPILSAFAGGATFGGFLWLLNIASAGRLGFGDVKAGALVGLAAGAFSFHVVWWVGMLAFTGALVASHVPRRRGSIPLGPFLFASYVVVATVLGGS